MPDILVNKDLDEKLIFFQASPVNQPDRSKHKDRIEAMIEEAHKYEEVSGAEELDKDEVIQVQADAGGQAKLIIPASTTPENG